MALQRRGGVQGPPGPQGGQGPVGPPGDPGEQGPVGVAGPQGPSGPTGPAGASGTGFVWRGNYQPGTTYNTGDVVFYTGAVDGFTSYIAVVNDITGIPPADASTFWDGITIQGPPGPQGAAGPVGAKGDTGAAGATGPTGPAGPAGAQGSSGPAGPAGPAGLTGAPGPAGPAGATGPTGPAGPAGTVATRFQAAGPQTGVATLSMTTTDQFVAWSATLTGDLILTINSLLAGQQVELDVTQDAVGAHAFSLTAAGSTGVPLRMNLAPNSLTKLLCTYDGTDLLVGGA